MVFKASKELLGLHQVNFSQPSAPRHFGAVQNLEFIIEKVERCFSDLDDRLNIVSMALRRDGEVDGELTQGTLIADSQIDTLIAMSNDTASLFDDLRALKGQVADHLEVIREKRTDLSMGLGLFSKMTFARRLEAVTEFNSMLRDVQSCVRDIKSALREAISSFRDEGKLGSRMGPDGVKLLQRLEGMKQAMNFSLLERGLKEVRSMVEEALREAFAMREQAEFVGELEIERIDLAARQDLERELADIEVEQRLVSFGDLDIEIEIIQKDEDPKSRTFGDPLLVQASASVGGREFRGRAPTRSSAIRQLRGELFGSRLVVA